MVEGRPGVEPQFRRILAVKLSDLGDLLAVTPALQAVRAAHPAARIDLLVPPSSAGLLQGASFLDRIVTFDKFPFDTLQSLFDVRGGARALAFLLKLRMSGYDALLIFHHLTLRWGSLKFGMLSVASGARVKAGLDNGRGRFLNRRAIDSGFGAMHEVDYWLQVAALVGADAYGGWKPQLPVSKGNREKATELLDVLGGDGSPLVAIHSGAGAYSRARIWGIEGFGEVARELARKYNARIVIVGGPDEREVAARLEGIIGEVSALNLAGQTSIHVTAAVLERCDLFVGNDSGPMHIAAAMGVPVVAVFGPSNSNAWGPYTPPMEDSKHKIVARDLPCMPCFYRNHSLGLREGCGPRPCLTGLPASAVLAACEEVLNKCLIQNS
ncbi:MAG: glycosyltransferase family 9 protein [Chloroflexia bacterium]